MVAAPGREELLDLRVGGMRRPRPYKGELVCDLVDGSLPVAEQLVVGDDASTESAGVPLCLERMPKPEQERLRRRVLVPELQRGGHFKRITNRKDEPRSRAEALERRDPDRHEPTKAGILDDELPRVRELALEDLDQAIF